MKATMADIHVLIRPGNPVAAPKYVLMVYLTASGNEAVLECTSGSYCCDSNRPELSGGTACCEASTSRFSLAALPLLPPYNDGGSVPSAASNSMPASASSSSTPPPAPPSSNPPSAPPSSNSSPAPPSSTPVQSSSTPPPPSSTPVQISSTPPSSTPPSNTPTPTSTPLSSSTAHLSTPSSTPQTFSTSISPTKVTSSSSLSTAGSSSPSIEFVTQIVTSDGSQSTIISSAASNGTEHGSTLSAAKRTDIGLGVGIPIGICFLAAIAFFWYRRSKRSRRPTPPPGILHPDFIDTKHQSSASSPFPHTPSTAPPDSHRSSTLVGTQTQPPQSAELQGSPTAGTFGISRGSGITRSAGTGASTSPRQSELPAMREVGGGNTNAAELPGAASPYRPYRPPGWS
ncbi:hypothetical protein JMJ35_003359 [Cladonia borealis]|uniref:Uncharacterized protein n=1 Tax=Cladonia borealis TaxID=184061 RepID=A0AA39R4J4_9LECA|nr:hypothetical protein JMJ35_003359 [Cladonia borealis]